MASPLVTTSADRALEVATRAAARLAALGVTGARLIGHDGDIPLLQIDPPPAEAGLLRTAYYGQESAAALSITCLSLYAGAVLVWQEERRKRLSRRLH